MVRIPADAEREQHIHMETIVDAYGPEEHAISWYAYLQEHLQFPFLTTCIARRATSPLRVRDGVEIVGMAPEEECMVRVGVVVGDDTRHPLQGSRDPTYLAESA
jgi:calcium binding protein